MPSDPTLELLTSRDGLIRTGKVYIWSDGQFKIVPRFIEKEGKFIINPRAEFEEVIKPVAWRES